MSDTDKCPKCGAELSWYVCPEATKCACGFRVSSRAKQMDPEMAISTALHRIRELEAQNARLGHFRRGAKHPCGCHQELQSRVCADRQLNRRDGVPLEPTTDTGGLQMTHIKGTKEFDATKERIEVEIEKLVKKRFPNARVSAYLMLVTNSGSASSVKTISRVEWLAAPENMREAARLIVEELESKVKKGGIG